MAKESSGRPEVAGQEADLNSKKLKKDAALKKAKKQGEVQEGAEQAAADQQQGSAFAKEGQVLVAQAGGTSSDAAGAPPPAGDGGGMSAGAWTAAILTTVGVAGIAIAASGGGGGGDGPSNNAPTANNSGNSGLEGATITGQLSASDVDAGQTLTFAATGALPAGFTLNPNGSYSLNTAGATYDALAAGQQQVLSIEFTVTDNGNPPLSTTGTLTITLTGTNDAPVALAVTSTAVEGNTVAGQVAATDVDTNVANITYSLVNAAPAGLTFNPNGSFSFNANDPVYNVLAAGATQTLVVAYTANDGQGGTSTANLTITVTGTNDAPVAQVAARTVAEDATTITGNLTATDVDNGDTLTFAISGAAPAGFTLNTNGSYSFNPSNAAYQSLGVGEQQVLTIPFTATDSQGASSTSTLTITVTGTNDAPVAQAQTLPAIEDTPLNGSVQATDVDGDALTYSVSGGGATAAGGQVVMQPNGSFVYTPAAGYSGVDSFTYQVSDGNGGTSNALVTINVANVVDVFTPATDIFNGSAADEVFIGTNANLNAGDSVNGGGGFDVVTHSVDGGLLNSYAGFIFQNVDVFQVTSDSPLSATTTYDLSSSGPIGTLRVVNSTDNIVFNNAAAGAIAANTTFLEILDQTGTTTDISLDIRDIDAAGGSDVVDITVRSATNVGNAIDDLNVDFAVETVRIHTDGPLAVVIDDLNTDLGGAVGSGAVNLILDAQDSSLTINTPLTANVKNVDGTSSTQNLTFSVLDANGNTTINTGSGNDTIVGAANFTNNVNSGAGNDSVTGGGVADNISTGMGADSVAGLAGNDNINTGEGNDTVDGGADNDTIVTAAGNDLIDDGTGNDTVDAGADNDTVNLNTGNDRLLLGDGLDVVNAGANLTVLDTITGGAGNDIVNILTDNATNDLNNVTQVERIVLQDDNTAYSYVIGNNSAFDGDNATIVTVDGSALDAGGVETLNFDASVIDRGIIIIGGSSNDTLTGGNSTDTLLGGVGNDILTGNNGNDTFVVRGNGEQVVGDVVSGGNGTDTLLALKDNVGGANETFVLGGGVTSVEQLNVRNQAFDNAQFNPDHLSSVTRNAGVVTITFDAAYNNGTTMTVDAQDSNNGLASGQNLVLDASANGPGAGENLIVRSGSGNDSLSFGTAVDQVFGNDGNDTINMNGGLAANDIVDGGTSTATNLDEGNSFNIEQVTGNQLLVNAGTVLASYNGVTNMQTLTITTAGTSQIGSNFSVVNLNPNGILASDTLNAGSYTTGLVVNDFSGNDSILTGTGNDTVNFGYGSDSVGLGNGANAVYVQETELDFSDSILGGSGTDTVRMDNSQDNGFGGAVNAGVNLSTVISVDRYEFTNNGDRDANNNGFDDLTGIVTNDVDFNFLTFTGGNVSSVTTITVDASTLTDLADTFTVTLDAGQTDADFRFDFIGSATDDFFVKQNTFIQNSVTFTGGAGDDTLIMDGDAQGANIVFDGGVGRGAAADTLTQAEALENAINGIEEGDAVLSSGGNWIDNDFTNISNIEILSALNGVSLNATLGLEAALSGLKVIVGSDVDDNVVFDPAFNDTDGIVIDVSAGGNDRFNASVITGQVQFVGNAGDFTANDTLTASATSTTDSVHIRNNGTAEIVALTNIELIKVERTVQGGDITINLGTAAGAPNGTNIQVIDASELQQNVIVPFSEDLTLNGQNSVLALSVTSGAGNDVIRGSAQNDTILGGSGNDQINGGTGADSLVGGDGNDVIVTGAFNANLGDGVADTVQAGAGNDTVIAGTGGDQIDLGAGGFDRVQLNPASAGQLVNGAPVITSFDGNDTISFSLALFADGTQTLAQDGLGVDQNQGDSWDDANHPELVAINGTVANANTALGVAQYLILQDLAENLNGQAGVFAVSDGTDTYLWHYQDDASGGVSAADFTLLATIRGITVGPAANQFSGNNMQLSYGFTNFDDSVLVVSGSTVNGLDGQDSITLIPNTTDGAVVQATSVETVIGTVGNDTITFADNAVATPNVEVFTGGGTDNITISDGQTLTLHSNANISVAGDVANTVDSLILANDGAPHAVNLSGIDSVLGSNGNDTITFLNNALQPANGATVSAGAGNDTVNGTALGDKITVTDVEQTLAGDGNDTITVSGANGTVNGGIGNDQVLGTGIDDVITTVAVESISAAGGNDTINAANNGQAVTINGDAGDDVITGSTFGDTINFNIATGGTDSVNAGTGLDTVNVSGAAVEVRVTFTSADVGNDTATDGGNTTNEDGGLAVRLEEDSVVGTAAGGVDGIGVSRFDDEGILFTGANFDVRDLPTGAARGVFQTVFLGTLANDTFTAFATNDYVNLGGGDDSTAGGLGNDFLVGNGGADTLAGEGGNDTLFGGGGADLMQGGADNDLLNAVGGGNDTLSGGAGNDTAVGTAASDTLTLDGIETLTADAGNDLITVTDSQAINADLGADNDAITFNVATVGISTISGGTGSDTVNGSTAGDTYSVNGVESVAAGTGNDDVLVTDTTAITVDLGAGSDVIAFSAAATATVSGGADSDTLTGSSAADALSVNGVEQVNSGLGDDDVTVTDGAATNVSLGGGADELVLAVAGNVTVNGGSENDTVTGSAANDSITVSAVEVVNAGNGSDAVVVTDTTAITIDLGFGDDSAVLTAAGGASATINGNAGLDTVVSGAGADRLHVQDVNVVSTAGGIDGVTVTDSTPIVADLGDANDTITFNTAATATVTGGNGSDTLNGSSGNDAITVFSVESAALNDGNDALTLGATAVITIDGGNGTDSVIGSAGNDTVTASAVESINGNDGDDDITFAGTITINGGAGADAATGSAGADVATVSGLEILNTLGGSDTVVVTDSTAMTVDLGDGSDSITFQVATDSSITGGAGSDSVVGSSDNDVIDVSTVENVSSGGGNDTINVFDSTAITIDGDPGSDLVTFATTSFATINGNSGSDTVTGSTLVDTLQFTGVEVASTNAGNDVVTVTDAISVSIMLGDDSDAITFTGATSNGSVNGGNGNDTLAGTSGVDTLTIDAVETISTGDGADLITSAGGLGSASLGSGNDTLTLTAATTANINGGDGNDSVNGSGGSDNLTLTAVEQLIAGGAADNISVTDGALSSVTLGAGTDTITFGAAATATIVGGQDGDIVNGSSGNDVLTTTDVGTINTGDGNDTLTAGGDAFDSVSLGAGSDVLTFDIEGILTVNGGTGSDTVNSSAATGTDTFTVIAVEVVNAGDNNDIITADGDATSVNLGAGNNTLNYSAAVAATVVGGAGNDFISGSANNDSFTISGVESVNGGGGASDVVTTTSGPDTLTVTNVESVTLGDGADSLTVLAGNTTVNAGAGNDSVLGGTGNDVIDGGAGQDTLAGGAGSDLFTFTVGQTSSETGSDADVISNFVSGTDDVELGGPAGVGANYAEADINGLFAAALASANAALNGTIRYFFAGNVDGGSGYLFFDANGNGEMDTTGDLIVRFSGGATNAATFDFTDIV